MSVWEKEPLQFFWHQEEPIDIYILNNKVLRCFYLYGSHGHFNAKVSFNLLLQLYNHPAIKSQLPKEFHSVFEGVVPYPIVDPTYHHFVGINDPQAYTSYLDLKMDVREGKEQQIFFHNIKYRNEPLKETFELTVQDAFYLLANICASTRIPWLQNTLNHWFEPCLHQLIKKKKPEYILSLYHKRYPNGLMYPNKEREKKLIGGVNLHEKYHSETIEKFLIKYLIHLNQMLLKKELDPYKLLRLSGTKPLAYLLSDEELYIEFLQGFFTKLRKISGMTSTQKLVYFAFLEVVRYQLNYDKTCTKIEPLFTKLYKKYSDAINQLRKHTEDFLPFNVKQYLEKHSDE